MNVGKLKSSVTLTKTKSFRRATMTQEKTTVERLTEKALDIIKDNDFVIKGLGEQTERLYQNQMSIVETNNVLIKRLQEQQATIDNLREIIRKKDGALNTLKDDITWLISGGLNSSGGISIEKGQANRMYETAQQALAINT